MGRADEEMKCIQMRTLMKKGEFAEALKVAESFDIDRVKSVVDLKSIASVYEQMGQYENAKYVMMQSYRKKRTRMTVYRLAYLSVKTGEFEDAEDFYEEFSEIAPNSPDRYILRYGIDRAKNVDYVLRIATLQKLKQIEYSEEWGYELAKIYHKAGLHEECIQECKDLVTWFGSGVIVDKAKLLCKYHQEGKSALDAYGVLDQGLSEEEIQQNREQFIQDTSDLSDGLQQVKEEQLRQMINMDMEKTVNLQQVIREQGDDFDLLKKEVHRSWGRSVEEQKEQARQEYADYEPMDPSEPIQSRPIYRADTEAMLAASVAEVMDRQQGIGEPEYEEPQGEYYDPAYDQMYSGYYEEEAQLSNEEAEDYGYNYSGMQEIVPDPVYTTAEEQMDFSYEEQSGQPEYETVEYEQVEHDQNEYGQVNLAGETTEQSETFISEASEVTQSVQELSEQHLETEENVAEESASQEEKTKEEQPKEEVLVAPEGSKHHSRRNARRAAKREKRRQAVLEKQRLEAEKAKASLEKAEEEIKQTEAVLEEMVSSEVEPISDKEEIPMQEETLDEKEVSAYSETTIEDESSAEPETEIKEDEFVEEDDLSEEETSTEEEKIVPILDQEVKVSLKPDSENSEAAIISRLFNKFKFGRKDKEEKQEESKNSSKRVGLQTERVTSEDRVMKMEENYVETKQPEEEVSDEVSATEMSSDNVMQQEEMEPQVDASEVAQTEDKNISSEEAKSLDENALSGEDKTSDEKVLSEEEKATEETLSEDDKELEETKQEEIEEDQEEASFIDTYGVMLWQYFEKYQNDKRLCENVYDSLERAMNGERPVNFMVTCKNKDRALEFSRDLAKALKALGLSEQQKVAKITAEDLNRMHLEQKYDQIKDRILLVQEAKKMTDDTAQSLMNMINELDGHVVVILTDARPYMKDLFEKYNMMKRYFPFDVSMR